jgi:hypothetical protein
MEPFIFEWKMSLTKYKQCKVKERLWSSSYQTPQYLPLKFYLRLFPHGDSEENADQISYFLFCEPPNGQTVTLKYNLYVLNEEGKRIAESPWTGEFGTKHQTWGKRRFCERPIISEGSDRERYMTFGCKVEVENFNPQIFKPKPSVPVESEEEDQSENEVHIVEEPKKVPAMTKLYPLLSGVKEIVIVEDIVQDVVAEVVPKAAVVVEEKEEAASENVDSTVAEVQPKAAVVEEEEPAASENNDSYQVDKFEDEWSDEDETTELTKTDTAKVLSKLSGKIAQLYEKMDISDVSLCISGEEIKAHKLILYLHSPCLAAMIKQDDWETAGTTKIDIEGFAPLTVQKALEFMYTENIAQVDELQVDQMMELSRFATMFSISDLKNFINNQIISAVNTTTACQLANLSMEYNEDAIHTTALEFITKNLQAIKLDDSFENLSGENAKAILRML